MSFNFHQVKTHEQSELLKLRARIILDIETFMSDEELSDDHLFPNFFQILLRKNGQAHESVGNGESVLACNNSFLISMLFKMPQDLRARLDAHMAKVDEWCAKTTSVLAAKDAAMAEMNFKLQSLLERSVSM